MTKNDLRTPTHTSLEAFRKRINRKRHRRCLRALAEYTDANETINLVDFLVDAMHWCRAEGLDFAAQLETARPLLSWQLWWQPDC
jgi:hypothetical protein